MRFVTLTRLDDYLICLNVDEIEAVLYPVNGVHSDKAGCVIRTRGGRDYAVSEGHGDTMDEIKEALSK